jgi:DNA-binding HxlR family transcriptional regulator
MVLLDALGERWTLRILWELRSRARTFRGLAESSGGVSPTLLNKRLKRLRDLGLVTHDAGSGYALTKDGAELGELLIPLNRWAERWAKRLEHPARQQGRP